MAKLKGIKGDFWKTDWFLGVVIAFLFAFVFLFLRGGYLQQSMERKAYDMGVKAWSKNPDDKIVLIGPTAAGVGTSFPTPISPTMTPVEKMAHSVSSILSEHFLVAPTWAVWLELLEFLLVAAYLIALLPKLKAKPAGLIPAGGIPDANKTVILPPAAGATPAAAGKGETLIFHSRDLK